MIEFIVYNDDWLGVYCFLVFLIASQLGRLDGQLHNNISKAETDNQTSRYFEPQSEFDLNVS